MCSTLSMYTELSTNRIADGGEIAEVLYIKKSHLRDTPHLNEATEKFSTKKKAQSLE